MGKHTMSELYQLQGLPLKLKILMTKRRIRDWVNWYGEVVVDYEGMGQLKGQMSIADYMTASEKEEFELDKPLLKTTGCRRTGCILCGFGCHLEKLGQGRFERLRETHPKVLKSLDIIQNSGITYREAIDWINENNGKGKIIYY